MRVPLRPEFREERQRFDLRFCCEDCAYFVRDPRGDQAHCAHGWPNAEHRLDAYLDETRREIVFCKEFELR
jgi:hypothetical protein